MEWPTHAARGSQTSARLPRAPACPPMIRHYESLGLLKSPPDGGRIPVCGSRSTCPGSSAAWTAGRSRHGERLLGLWSAGGSGMSADLAERHIARRSTKRSASSRKCAARSSNWCTADGAAAQDSR